MNDKKLNRDAQDEEQAMEREERERDAVEVVQGDLWDAKRALAEINAHLEAAESCECLADLQVNLKSAVADLKTLAREVEAHLATLKKAAS